ncbi:hypothetical protein TSL1_13110 [Sulfurovum sp. TSL1]|nr:hypothetical protein TSL1_13110 [Sulfurovum sp. TSL1]
MGKYVNKTLIYNICLIASVLLFTGCSSKNNDENSSEDVNNYEVNSSIITESHFIQDPSRVANANQRVYLAVEHQDMLDTYMSSDDSGEKGCDTIKYYLDDSLKEITVDDDMEINVTIYKDDVEVAKIAKGEKATIDKAGEYVFEVCHSGHGYKDMHLPVFIIPKPVEDNSPSINKKLFQQFVDQNISEEQQHEQAGQIPLTNIAFQGDYLCTQYHHEMTGLSFIRSDFSGVKMEQCNIHDNIFDHCHFDMKTSFQDSTLNDNNFTGMTFFPQTLHKIPSFSGNNVSNSILMAPSFVYKQDPFNVGKTDLTNTTFKNSQIYSPIFGAEVSYQVYVKPPWYDVLLHGLEDAWDAAKTAKFWENVGEAAGIGIAMAGLAIVTDGVADAAAGPALADALADSTADIVTDVASDTASDAAGDTAADELPATGDGLSNLKQYDDVNFDMMEDGDAGSDVTDYDTVDEFDLGSQWDQYDEISDDEVPEDANAENICESSYATKALVASKTAMAGIGFGVSYLQQLRSGKPANANFFEETALASSVGAFASVAAGKKWCDEYDKINNRNAVTGKSVVESVLLKQIAKGSAITLGIDAISAYANDLNSILTAEEEKLKEAFAGLKNPNDDITAITTAFAEMLVDDNVTKYFTKIKRHYLGSEISKTATYIENNITVAVNDGTIITGPAKIQQMSQSMQKSILEDLKTGGDHNEIASSTVAGNFINCVITTPKFGNLDGFDVTFGEMNNSMFATYSSESLPSPLFMTELNDVSIYGGTYDLGSYTKKDGGRYGLMLTGSGITIYNAVFNNVTSLNLDKATLSNTRINTNPSDPMFDPTSDNNIPITNSNILNNTIITIPNNGAVQQNIIVSDSNIRNSFLDLPTNSSVDFSGTTIGNLNDCQVFMNDPYPAMDNCLGANASNNLTVQFYSQPINSATQIWSNSSLSCQDIANIRVQGNSFGTAEVFFGKASNINLEGVSFKNTDGCVLTGLVDMLHDGNITNSNNLTIDYNIFGIKDVYTFDDRIKYKDIIIHNMIIDASNWSQSTDGIIDLTNIDMSGFIFSNLTFGENVDFSGANFSDANFTNVTFSAPVNITITDVNFSNAHFNNVSFNGTIDHSDYSNAVFENVPVNMGNGNAQLTNSKWYGVKGITFCDYLGYDVYWSENLNIFGTSLAGADLSSGCIFGIDIPTSGWSLVDSNLSGASFGDNTNPDNKVFLKDVNLSGSDLTYANFDNVDFSGAILNGAKFRPIRDTDLLSQLVNNDLLKDVDWSVEGGAEICALYNTNPDLLGKRMVGADLNTCNFDDQNLSGWNLSNSIMPDVGYGEINIDFSNADLTGVDWNQNDMCYSKIFQKYKDQLQKSMINANLMDCSYNSDLGYDFSGWDLRRATLPEDSMQSVNFTGANLQKADINYTIVNPNIVTLPTNENSLKNIDWSKQGSADMCDLVTPTYASALGKTLYGVDLSFCTGGMYPMTYNYFNGWDLTNAKLPEDFNGDLSCAIVDGASIGSTPIGFYQCGPNSTNGQCLQTNFESCY